MKKIISVVLAAVLVFACASVGFANEKETVKFAVASDLHYVEPSEELEVNIPYESVMWNANRRAAMENESGFIIDEFLRQCAEDADCEFVLIPGDLANDGRIIRQQHLDVAEKLKKFESETGKPVYVINGNHDNGAGENDVTYKDFKEIYWAFGYDEALYVDEDTCSYTAELPGNYRLIALDSCDPTRSTADGMTKEKINWVCEEAKKAYADGKYPILMMHHNLLDHMPLQSIFSKNFIIKNHISTANKFADAGIKLVFTGHEHCSDGAVHTSNKGNKIYDFATTSLTMYPAEFRMFTASDEEFVYEAKAIEKIDVDALTSTVSGYTEEHIALMNENFNSVYAKEYLKCGVKYRLGRDLKMEAIGIEEGEPFYNLVNTAVGGLNKILEDPLYGEGGIQELAKGYNIDIPDSDYENIWDVATELVAAHYEGEENYPLDSKEVTIFLRAVALLLRDDLAAIADETLLGAANFLLEKVGVGIGVAEGITKLCTAVFGGVSAVEYFLVALLSPILYEFVLDDDGVPDNNGSIPGYAVAGKDVATANVFENISNIAKLILTYISNMFKILIKIF